MPPKLSRPRGAELRPSEPAHRPSTPVPDPLAMYLVTDHSRTNRRRPLSGLGHRKCAGHDSMPDQRCWNPVRLRTSKRATATSIRDLEDGHSPPRHAAVYHSSLLRWMRLDAASRVSAISGSLSIWPDQYRPGGNRAQQHPSRPRPRAVQRDSHTQTECSSR
jgi:hypothetical protein